MQEPKGPNPDGIMLHYGQAPIENEQALERWLSAEGGNGSSFVKFMAPWCPHCRHMGPAFLRASELLKNQVNAIEVDCEENRDLCRKYHINSFPTLRMYKNGVATEYVGGRSYDAMAKWALKAGGNALHHIDAFDLERLAQQHEVFFLYLYSSGTSEKERASVTNGTSVLLGKDTYAFESSNQTLIDRYSSYLHPGQGSAIARKSLSGLLVFKGHNLKRPHAKLNTPGTLSFPDPVAQIKVWVHQERFPNVIEVVSTNFADVIFNDAGFKVVVATVSDVHHGGNVVETGSGAKEKEYELASFRNMTLLWQAQPRNQHVFFAWIDADRWATAMKQYFNLRGIDLPKLLLVDGSKKQFWDLPSDSLAAARGKRWLVPGEIFDKMSAVAAGKVKGKSMETYIDRSMHAASSITVQAVTAYFHHPIIGSIFLIVGLILTIRFIKRAKHQALHGRHGSRRLTSQSSLPFTSVEVPGKTKSG